jgi:hypothetical protein
MTLLFITFDLCFMTSQIAITSRAFAIQATLLALFGEGNWSDFFPIHSLFIQAIRCLPARTGLLIQDMPQHDLYNLLQHRLEPRVGK